MKRILFLTLLISFTLGQTSIKRSRRSRHGEDCFSDAACEEGLVCKINRCYTKYESSNLNDLGLYESNLCSDKKKCPSNKKCVKHRCIPLDTPEEPPKNRTVDFEIVHLLFSGGIFLDKKPYLSGIKPDNTINYDHLFEHVSFYIKSADLAVTFQNTPFYISEDNKLKKNQKYTPKELGDAIAKAGFKVVLHASSQAYNLKEKGIKDTVNFWKEKYPDIHALGISSTLEESQKDYYIFQKNGVKIAIINYNGFVGKSIPTKNQFMVNTISKKKVEDCVKALREKADFIIVCINWGEKYGSKPTSKTIEWAKVLASLGVNLIIGNFPSYVQPVTFVKAKNGNCALVFFSLGALVGENTKKKDALGALANIVITKENGKTFISSYRLIPTINHVVPSSDYTVYRLHEYSEELGKEANKKFDKKKVIKTCKKQMGAFAHCG